MTAATLELALRPSEGASIVRFIEQTLVHGVGDFYGQRPVLRHDQKLLIYEWHELDDEGLYQYNRMYLETPKGAGKTMLFAWLAIAHLLGPWAPKQVNLVVSANSKVQAGQKTGDSMGDGIFGRIAEVLSHRDCPWGALVEVYEDRIVRKDGCGHIELRAASATASDGGVPSLYMADEVQDWGGAKSDAHERNENSTTKTSNGRSMSCSTPGSYKGQPVVGWRLHEYGEKVRTGVVDDPHFLYSTHRAGSGWDLTDRDDREAAVREANIGIDNRRCRRVVNRYQEIPHNRWCRFHLGWWMESEQDSWMRENPSAWSDCEDPSVGIPRRGTIAVGVDMAHSRDTAAIVWGWRDPETGKIVVRCKIWTPNAGRTVSRLEMKTHLRWLNATYEVRGVSYDPAWFESEAEELESEIPMIETPQSHPRMVVACGEGFEAIVEGNVVHDGHAELSLHISAARKKDGANGWTLSKGRSLRHIDGAIAFCLMVRELSSIEGSISMYETVGLS